MEKNYFKLYTEELSRIKSLGIKPRLLLHACCAPCSSAVLEKLKDYFDITLFFYNPNISPESEFNARLKELENEFSNEKANTINSAKKLSEERKLIFDEELMVFAKSDIFQSYELISHLDCHFFAFQCVVFANQFFKF